MDCTKRRKVAGMLAAPSRFVPLLVSGACMTMHSGGLVAPAANDDVPAAAGPTHRLTFVSTADWASYAADVPGANGDSLGHAREVCLTPTIPADCRAGALVYRASGTGWTAGPPHPLAQWIWRGDVARNGAADLQVAAFEKTFTLGKHPTGTIEIGADDFAEVMVNREVVGSVGSVSDINAAVQSQSVLTTFSLTPYLNAGQNTITIVGQNGPSSYASCSAPCTYAENPAGVIFAGVLDSQ